MTGHLDLQTKVNYDSFYSKFLIHGDFTYVKLFLSLQKRFKRELVGGGSGRNTPMRFQWAI